VNTPSVLALDFDGLLVDGLHECILVTWYGHHGADLDQFSDEGLARIPASFATLFQQHRSYAKHLGHFAMPVQDDAVAFESQAAFDAAYARLDPQAIEAFVERVGRYREGARQRWRQRWLAYHRFYPGLDALLRDPVCPVCIVTAKDRGSVQEILQQAGIHLPDAQVHGECRDKRPALTAIAERFGCARQGVHFYDDNVFNARDAQQAGFTAHWATWGYRAPEHTAIALEAGLPAVELPALARLTGEALA
jgi:phosphoglycolate phosphatase-like HAD superfamily hydrolase